MAHRLDPLLRPTSVAVIGASARPESLGHATLANLLKGKYPGKFFAVNPSGNEILGVQCHTSIKDIQEPIEHAIFCVSDKRIEAALDDAIEHGIKAATIMSTLILEDDTAPVLKDRIQKKVRDAGILLCGANGMGFYNFNDQMWACGFETRDHTVPGNVALISHSGSGMHGLVDSEGRIDFNLAVSTGQELSVTMADYLDFALEMPGTKVVGLFMETVRDIDGMTKALEKAKDKAIPIVAVKLGRTEFAAKMARSHSGAMVGNDSAYEAYFQRHGVMRVADQEELATALILFAQPHPVGKGGLVAMHDSGGIRQLVIDLADKVGTELTDLSPQSVKRLEDTLEPGLPAVNPLDSWSAGGEDWLERADGYMTTLLQDENAAIGAVMQERAPDSQLAEEYVQHIRAAHAATGKPGCVVSGHAGSGSDSLAIQVTREGFPILDGYLPFLKGVKCLFDYRDFLAQDPVSAPTVDTAVVEKWRAILNSPRIVDEALGAELFADFNIPALPYKIAVGADEAVAAAETLGFPVVLKTAEDGIEHKSDVGGVLLNLKTPNEVRAAYQDIAARLGARVAITKLVTEPGVEMILGASQDDPFGPLIMMGFGGIYAETLKDAVFLLPPFDADTATRKLDELKLRPMLDGQRGAKPVNIEAFAHAAANFSVMIHKLRDDIAEIDINPLLVTEDGCIALDALVVPAPMMHTDERSTG